MPSAPPPCQGFQKVLQVPDARDTGQQVRLSEVDVTKITWSCGWVGCRVYKAKSHVKATAPPQEPGPRLQSNPSSGWATISHTQALWDVNFHPTPPLPSCSLPKVGQVDVLIDLDFRFEVRN